MASAIGSFLGVSTCHWGPQRSLSSTHKNHLFTPGSGVQDRAQPAKQWMTLPVTCIRQGAAPQNYQAPAFNPYRPHLDQVFHPRWEHLTPDGSMAFCQPESGCLHHEHLFTVASFCCSSAIPRCSRLDGCSPRSSEMDQSSILLVAYGMLIGIARSQFVLVFQIVRLVTFSWTAQKILFHPHCAPVTSLLRSSQ